MFDGTNGNAPSQQFAGNLPLVQATNGDLYRTTAYGGANTNSSVPNGTTPPLESSRLPNGDFYGVMESGGTDTLNGQPHGICAVSGFR
jgi:hypothetical protein